MICRCRQCAAVVQLGCTGVHNMLRHERHGHQLTSGGLALLQPVVLGLVPACAALLGVLAMEAVVHDLQVQAVCSSGAARVHWCAQHAAA